MSKKEEPQKKLVRRYLKQIVGEARGFLTVALFFAVGGIIAFVLQAFWMAKLFGHLFFVGMHKISLDQSLIRYYLCFIAVMLLLRLILHYGRSLASQKASIVARECLQKKLLNIISELGPEVSVFGSEGALSTKLMEQIDALDPFISRYYVQVVVVVITPIIISSVLIWYSLVAVIIFIVSMPLIIVFMILVGMSAAGKSREQFQALSNLSGYFLDLIRGMKTLVDFNAVVQAREIITNTSEWYRKRTIEVLRLAFLSVGTLEFFATVSIAAIALYLGFGLMGNFPGFKQIILVPYESALLILLLAPEFYAPLRMLGADYHAKASAEGAVMELIPILEHETWLHPGKKILQFVGPPAICAREVSIYSSQGDMRLAPLSFDVNSGERIRLKGDSGVGKSSLFDALLAFVPYEGCLLINDISLRELQRDSWHEIIGYLAQTPRLISGTIATNLRLAKPQATDEELFAVLKEVGLGHFVAHLPLGLNTQLGERGLGLSGGQRGRLAIAQLLLKEALLWLIDEPTEHLDPDTGALIMNLLEKVTRGKTVLLITHQETAIPWLNATIKIG